MQRKLYRDSYCIPKSSQVHSTEVLDVKKSFRRRMANQMVRNEEIFENLNGSSSSKSNIIEDEESMHVAIRPYVLLGQCFGLIPACGILKTDPNELRFSWKSKRVIYAVVLLSATVMIAIVETSSSMVLRGLTYKSIVDMISLVLSIVEIVFCLQEGQSWPALITEWTQVEQKMKHFRPIIKYNRKVKVLVYTYVVGAIVLVVAQISIYMHMLRRCTKDSLVLVKLAVVAMYYPVFSILGVSVLTLTILMCFTMHHYILVIYDELTITVLSFCLAVKFRQFNRYLERYKTQRLPWTFWAEMREIFNSLSSLSKHLDSHLSRLTFLCFGANLYYHCSLILDMLSGSKKNTWSSIFILLFTLTRTLLAALAASFVAEDSKKPLASLFSVTSDSYNVEVCRFQIQVAHDDIAITGCNFFSVNRSFILTVAGTIMTYEIVLLQFGNITLESSGPTNNTALCLKVMNLISG